MSEMKTLNTARIYRSSNGQALTPNEWIPLSIIHDFLAFGVKHDVRPVQLRICAAQGTRHDRTAVMYYHATEEQARRLCPNSFQTEEEKS